MRYTDYKFRSERNLAVFLSAVKLELILLLYSVSKDHLFCILVDYTLKCRHLDCRSRLNTFEVTIILQSHILLPVYHRTAALCNWKLTKASSFGSNLIFMMFHLNLCTHPLVQISEIHPDPHPSARDSRHPLHLRHRRVGPKRIDAATHPSLLRPAVQLFPGQSTRLYITSSHLHQSGIKNST